jgi:hypothetical protein
VTAQGHPRAIFERAIERGNLLVAETTLRTEIPRPTLVDLLELTALIAQKDPKRHAPVAARWLQRWLDAFDDATIYDVALAASALQALGSRHHRHAMAALRGMAEEATGRGRARGVGERRAGSRCSTRAFGSPPGPLPNRR